MKPKYNTAKFRSQTLGASLVTAIVVCLSGSPAYGIDNFWTGSTSTDWNTASNWSLGRVPVNPNGNVDPAETFDDAVVNDKPSVVPNIATITANVPTPRDFRVGQGSPTANGRVDHTAGSASTGGGNWAFVGRDGATGVYNLANTAAAGGAFTGFAQGSGNFTCNGSRLYVGGQNGAGGGTGTFNMNTTGTLNVGNWLMIGSSAGATGVMNVDSGAVNCNDMTIGVGGGTGTLNISNGTFNTTGWNYMGKNEEGNGATGTLKMTGGTLLHTGITYVGQGTCTGYMTLSGGTYKHVNNEVFMVGGTINWADWFGTTGGTGFLTIDNSASLLECPGEFWIGNRGGTGTMTLSAGTVITNNWTCFGRNSGSSGTVIMSGGTFTKNGGGNFLIGDAGTATLTQSGGALTVNGEFWVGQGGGNGTYNLSGGTVTNNNWVAVGREGGTGTFTMTGGTWTKTNGGNFAVGNSGPGTMTQNAGLVDVQGGDTYMGDGNVCNYTLSGTGEFRATYFQVARNGGATGNVNLDGGTLRANQIVGGGGAEHVHFNGTQIIAKQTQPNFIAGMDAAGAAIDAGGLKINSNTFNLGVPQNFSGTGGVTKSGAGTLTLSGVSTYTGANSVNAGTLVVTTRTGAAPNSGNYTVADGTTLGVTQLSNTESLSVPTVTFGTSNATTLNIDLGNIAGNPAPTDAALKVTGTLAVNGTVTVNVADLFPVNGVIPLISYPTGGKTGSGSFVLGTIPNGVVLFAPGTIIDDPNYLGSGKGLVYINAQSVSLPKWRGTVDGLTSNGIWDVGTTQNWTNQVTVSNTAYNDPAPVLFADNINPVFTPNVTLNVTVQPSKVTFTNSSDVYTLTGSGKISGSASLLKQGSAPLTITTLLNDYTGTTTLEGGTTSVDTLANGGSPSSIGASGAGASNLVLSGGTLNYTGATTSIDRGFSVAAANSCISTTNNLTLSGAVTASVGGTFKKAGAGVLTLSNPGANVLSNGGLPGVRIDQGSLVLSGGGTQTNSVSGDIWVATTTASGANLVLNNTTLNSAGNYLAIARGSGTTGLTSTCTLTNSTLTTGNLSLGYANGLGSYSSIAVLTLNDSTYTMTGISRIGESGGGTGTVVLNGASTMTCNETNVAQDSSSNGTLDIKGTSLYTSNARLQVGPNGGSTGNVIIENSGHLVVHTYVSVGYNGGGSMTVKDSGTFTGDNDFSVNESGDVAAFVTLQDTGTISVAGTTFVGRNTGRAGTVTQTGGTYTGNGLEFQIGRSGTGTWQQSGGITNAGGWVSIGRETGGTGILAVSGTGAFNQTGTDRGMIVGENGTGTLTLQGTATVSSVGTTGMIVSNLAGAVGVVNLDGGTLSTLKISDGGGNSTFNFNGGLLKANTGAASTFMAGLDAAIVKAGGAKIDSNGQDITINQSLQDGGGGGGLTKTGTGTLYLNGLQYQTGTTRVSAGTLAGAGDYRGGPLVVGATANLNPGVGTDLLYVGFDTPIAATFEAGSSLTIDIAGSVSDQLVVTGALDISGAALVLNGTLTDPVYVIASYGSLVGTGHFASVPALPAGYSVDYHYLGGNQIALVQSANPYSAWASSYGLDPLTDGAPGFDKDGDGQINALEFALGGSPISGSDNAKIYNLVADSDADLNTINEQLVTIAVRAGTPAFTGSPSPTASKDGVTYTVEGSTTLNLFPVGVSVVGTVTPPAPHATPPAGYEYRTFSLSGSDGLPNKGFLRVKVE